MGELQTHVDEGSCPSPEECQPGGRKGYCVGICGTKNDTAEKIDQDAAVCDRLLGSTQHPSVRTLVCRARLAAPPLPSSVKPSDAESVRAVVDELRTWFTPSIGHKLTLPTNHEYDMAARAVIYTVTRLAAARLSVREGEWLPIETAPKDGTDVIIAYPIHGKPADVFIAHHGELGWVSDHFWRLHEAPIGWQPLPKSPA